ncbi:hypothetical protein G3580_17065 [Nitrogeniibacter mangrovi]|uniref:Uncharacterized protein n=1 Tax=Nitrogeniibacter mangrovi TaxID=2016596 RepID=A0A6C1B620_9RHOO|nr:hypothetical protein [Nitrogeniibacter mangrovi]QID19176.1 hypothetical protein G3580_17065 [Nitrogeniibacter mangrovi]
MNTAFVMVILTLLADGQLSAAFVNTPTQAQCEQRAVAVGAILKKGGANVQQIRCIPSELQFTRFSHANAGTAPRHAYVLALGAHALGLTPVDDVAACRAGSAQRPVPEGATRYCVTSTQTPLPAGS